MGQKNILIRFWRYVKVILRYKTRDVLDSPDVEEPSDSSMNVPIWSKTDPYLKSGVLQFDPMADVPILG